MSNKNIFLFATQCHFKKNKILSKKSYFAVFNILEKFKVPRQSENNLAQQITIYFVLKVNSNQLRTKRKRVKPNEMKLTIFLL